MAVNAQLVVSKRVHIEATFPNGDKVKLDWPVREARAIAHEILRATEDAT